LNLMAAMTSNPNPAPMPVQPAPEVLDEHAVLAEALTRGLKPCTPSAPEPAGGAAGLRARLLQRTAASSQRSAAMVTVRRRHLPHQTPAPGVQVQWLYRADTAAAAARTLRPGEPVAVRLFELSADARLPASALALEAVEAVQAHHAGLQDEWLVLRGAANVAGQTLSLRDYLVLPPGHADVASDITSRNAARDIISHEGALLMLRQAWVPPAASTSAEAPMLVRDAAAGWSDFAPGIQRRVLWQRAGQAAMLYFTEPGASVPHHGHGHDEECLMVQGDLFLDDVLLQEGDYQLAPAGSGHHSTTTDTGVVLYAHGDLELQFKG
jgi:quercetin dioxygenase-like cupin family protein